MESISVGVDIGSAAIKVVVLSGRGQLMHSAYVPHHYRVRETLRILWRQLMAKVREGALHLAFTGKGAADTGEAGASGRPVRFHAGASPQLLADDRNLFGRCPSCHARGALLCLGSGFAGSGSCSNCMAGCEETAGSGSFTRSGCRTTGTTLSGYGSV